MPIRAVSAAIKGNATKKQEVLSFLQEQTESLGIASSRAPREILYTIERSASKKVEIR